MSTFLNRILAVKTQEVAQLRARRTALEDALETAIARGALAVPRGFAAALVGGQRLSIVAEVKRASPSKGLIAPDFDAVATAQTYQAAGANAVSVLTDQQFFQGSIQDLQAVRQAIDLPVLRKDFIIDEMQILEARLAGADAVLLIVAALEGKTLQRLSAFAKSLDLDVLIEIHEAEELAPALAANPSVLGINNRSLHTFAVSLQTTVDIMNQVPAGVPTLAESGIQAARDAQQMAHCGVMGLLVGESLMRAGQSGVAALMTSLRAERSTPRIQAP